MATRGESERQEQSNSKKDKSRAELPLPLPLPLRAVAGVRMGLQRVGWVARYPGTYQGRSIPHLSCARVGPQ